MKLFRQTYPAGNRWTFSVSLPGYPKFRPEETFETAAEAAFFCDLFKLILVSRYKLTGNTMWNSLAPDAFKAAAYEGGINLKDATEVFSALPKSCRDFLLDGGHETLTEFMNNQVAIHAGGQETVKEFKAGFRVDGTKKCLKCGLEKTVREFQKNNLTSDGLRSDCRKCEAARTIQIKYAITPEALDLLIKEQGGVCAICKTDKKLCVDHDHTSGKIRALLCGHCNSALGFLHDSPFLATEAALYLTKHGK